MQTFKYGKNRYNINIYKPTNIFQGQTLFHVNMHTNKTDAEVGI